MRVSSKVNGRQGGGGGVSRFLLWYPVQVVVSFYIITKVKS